MMSTSHFDFLFLNFLSWHNWKQCSAIDDTKQFCRRGKKFFNVLVKEKQQRIKKTIAIIHFCINISVARKFWGILVINSESFLFWGVPMFCGM